MTDGSEGTVPLAEYSKVKMRADQLDAEVVELKKRLEKFDGIDLTALKAKAQDYDSLLAQKKEWEKESKNTPNLSDLEAQVREKLDADYQKQYGKQLEDLKSELQSKSSRLNELEIVTPGIEKFIAANGNKDAIPLFKSEIAKNIMLHEGQLVAKGEDGKPRRSNVNPKQYMDVEEWIGEQRKVYPFMFLTEKKGGTMRPGAGQEYSHYNGEVPTLEEIGRMTPAEVDRLEADRPGILAQIIDGR